MENIFVEFRFMCIVAYGATLGNMYILSQIHPHIVTQSMLYHHRRGHVPLAKAVVLCWSKMLFKRDTAILYLIFMSLAIINL